MKKHAEANSWGVYATGRPSWLKHSILSLIIALGFLGTARADLTAINLSTVVQLNSGAGDETLGWEFAPTSNLMVTELGLLNATLGGAGDPNGFQQSHVVAIWDMSGHLLTSASLAAGTSAPLIGNFRFVNAPSAFLNAGQHYVIGGFYPSPVSDAFTDRNVGDPSVHVDPDLNFVAERWSPSPGGIAFPTSVHSTIAGDFGPNFMFTVVPEPTALPLIGLGVAAFARFRPRR